jgi:hypothetical protein
MGVIVASGGRTVSGDLGRRSLADLAPTALAFHGIDPGATDGRAIEQIAGMGGGGRSGGASTRIAAARTRSFMNEDEERFVEQHLRDLGYLE